jgi:hypothetical protein
MFLKVYLPVQFRHILGGIGWDAEKTMWLHAAILDLLERDLLEEYIEILRLVRAQVYFAFCLHA